MRQATARSRASSPRRSTATPTCSRCAPQATWRARTCCGSDRCECPGSPGPSPSPDTKCSWEEHVNSDGNNLLQAPWSQDPQACCNHCGEQSGCVAWTFIQGSHECWLKSWVPSRDQWRWDDSAISGQIGAPSLQAALDAPSNSSLQGLLSETIYCNPYLQQMCPPGDVACPQCGSDRCECPSSPGPSPSPDTKCSWEEHRNSDGNNLLQAPWSQDPQACCNHCGGQSGCAAWTFIQGSHECWLKSWVPSRDQWRWDDSAISGQIGAPSLQAALDAPSNSSLQGLLSETIYCNPYLQQMCPPGDVACPQCGSDRCECPSSPGPSPSPDTKCSWEEHVNSDGNNLLQAPWSQDPQACCNHCGGQSGCAAWTFIQGSHECWLKSWVPSRDQWRWDDSAISGILGGR
ncbi:unnamed protein product [Prorocentrum cordatum]|uniref:Apple domain-containing protein n=1 Tax=Prorocentrum cordatum TaxID=2364126 RepID=A0ABN9U089_9DINO|nr:unnamed protein product [Polarella glacialis]